MTDRSPTPPPAVPAAPANRAARRARGKGARPVLPPAHGPVRADRAVPVRGAKNYAVRQGG